jgi:GTP-binding protein
MTQDKIRNIAIIAHVDHGKTTLVDEFFKQSGMFRNNQVVEERMMDSNELEKERGITISSKNGSFKYKDFFINVIDTPGHADFGGQVERVLRMADGALLLVDAAEGPMPQTYFVLKKALALNMPIILVINKIDKPDGRPDWVLNEVYDLFVKLGAPDHLLDFPVMYASAKNGYSSKDEHAREGDMIPLFEEIARFVPAPNGDSNAPFKMAVSSISYSSFLGRLAIGRIASGKVEVNKEVAALTKDADPVFTRISKIYKFEGVNKVEGENASCGEIVAVAGLDFATVGMTVSDKDDLTPLESIDIDPPSISMNFLPNDSHFAGTEGKFVTSRHIRERLFRETLFDVSLVVEELTQQTGYKVSGRGELHLSILIEKMRREGYEFQVTRPTVIIKEENGIKMEPYEELTVDVSQEYSGNVIENLGKRKGSLLEMYQENDMVRLKYKIPTRGLLGFKSEFMTETRGMGIMNYVFSEYDKYCGELPNRSKGSLIVKETCQTVAFALFNLQPRGSLFVSPGEKVYEGQIVGECSRDNDLVVNPGKGKKLTNMRASGSDENIVLTPATKMSLEKCISYINDDEMVEVTPKSIRLRKIYLNEIDRKKAQKAVLV